MPIKILSPVKISTSRKTKTSESRNIIKMNIKQLTIDISNRIKEDNSLGKHLFI